MNKQMELDIAQAKELLNSEAKQVATTRNGVRVVRTALRAGIGRYRGEFSQVAKIAN